MNCENNSLLDCDDKDCIRKLWEHEDDLINHRMTWLGVTQGLLFAAYGVVLNIPITSDNKQQLEKLSQLITDIGFYTSTLILVGITAAIIAMWKIKNDCNQKQLGITTPTTVMGWICAAGLPLVFIYAWKCIG